MEKRFFKTIEKRYYTFVKGGKCVEEVDQHHFHFKLENNKGETIVKGELTGVSEIPFHDDLKMKGVIALLNSVDQENFDKANQNELFLSFVGEIEETLEYIKKFKRFQGEINT